MFSNLKNASLTNVPYKKDQKYEEWYVVFERRPRAYWYDMFVKPQWRHCYAIKWDGFNWIMVYPHTGFTDVSVLPQISKEDFTDLVKHKRWIKVEAMLDPTKIRVPQFVCVWFCVEQIKALLGIRDVRIITPKQLWDYLQSDGQA